IVWAPISGLGYPFPAGAFFPNSTEERYQLLDTNYDGMLTIMDDPFAPYWPGDEYVDWVSLSIYEQFAPIDVPHFEPMPRFAGNSSQQASPSSFVKIVNRPASLPTFSLGSSSFESQLLTAGTDYSFYNIYALHKKKPLMVSTGSSFYRGSSVIDQTDEDSVKSVWNAQIFNETTLNRSKSA
ncbi:hypothetical protein HDU91_001040, partial [Kappamyces sp. JEL0680]